MVKYNKVPILEEEKNVAAGVSPNSLSKMLHGKMTMRELMLRADMLWNITVGEGLKSSGKT